MAGRRTEHELRRGVVEVSRLLWERGYVANHDGNVTARIATDRIVATATGISKRVVDGERLLVVNDHGERVRGRARAFSELGLHLAVYRGRPDVGAVVHAHPPEATARAVTGSTLPCFLPESVVSLGPEIPLVPFAVPGAPAELALAPFVEAYDVVLLGGHGVLAWGDDVEQAFLRLELAEHLCGIARRAEAAGGVKPLPADALGPLLEARRRAGLGPEAR